MIESGTGAERREALVGGGRGVFTTVCDKHEPDAKVDGWDAPSPRHVDLASGGTAPPTCR
jgi:hypothetical protein